MNKKKRRNERYTDANERQSLGVRDRPRKKLEETEGACSKKETWKEKKYTEGNGLKSKR